MNAGTLAGPPLIGFMIQNYGWGAASNTMAISCILGTMVLAAVKLRNVQKTGHLD